jgi:primary-amine oxidase
MTIQQDMPLRATTTRLNMTVASSLPHPLEPLSVAESERARQTILNARGRNVLVKFRAVFLEEPAKNDLVPFLEAEHAGRVGLRTPRPARLAMVHYDVVRSDKNHEYTHSIVDLSSRTEKVHRVIDRIHQAALTT